MVNKIILAFQENHKELLEVKKHGEIEEEFFCEGYENAINYVLVLFGISYDEALNKKIK
jgi:hypothetical protein